MTIARRRGGLRAKRALRVKRGMAALRLAARGGARYAGNAPRLFASAGEHREQLRNDLAPVSYTHLTLPTTPYV